MKHFMTLIALVVAVTAGAQGTTIHEYPWNPDSNNDNLIGVDDLLDFLPVFGDEFGNPPEPCDYDGTPLEDLVIGIADGSIVLDSMFIEYELEDVSTYYVIGCPDPVTDTLIFSNSAMLNNFYSIGNTWSISGYDSYGEWSSFKLLWNLTDGKYRFSTQSNSLLSLGFVGDGFFTANGGGPNAITAEHDIPFPEGWYLDDDGIHLEYGWLIEDWPYYANYLHILPYWHYAE